LGQNHPFHPQLSFFIKEETSVRYEETSVWKQAMPVNKGEGWVYPVRTSLLTLPLPHGEDSGRESVEMTNKTKKMGPVRDFVCEAVHGLTKHAVHTESTAKRSA
jgi:hypothetical protein